MANLLFKPEDYPELTYQDVCLIPNNPIEERLVECATITEWKTVQDMKAIGESEYRHALLDLADKYNLSAPFSRDGVDLKPNGGLGNTPITVANMNAVVGQRLAEAIARVGGLATIPQDKTDKEIRSIVDYLRSRHPVYETPIAVDAETKAFELMRLINKRSHGNAIVKNADGKLIGVIGKDELKHINGDKKAGEVMRGSDMVTAKDGINPIDAIHLMDSEHVNYLPILGTGDEVIGVLPKIDAAMRLRYNANINPERGGLRAAFTVGALNNNPIDRVKLLLELGIYDIQFDTAHADQGTRVYRNVELAIDEAIRMGINPEKLNIIVGNVVTRTAVKDIMLAGAKYAKGGIGPGHACTTRMETGVGRPQLSMIMECAEEAHKRGGYLIADGGIRWPRDVSIALAAGADYVMIGSLFAGTYESPPDISYDEEGKPFKENFGMASRRASVDRTNGKKRTDKHEIFRDIVGHRAEGISSQKVKIEEGRESVALLQHWFLDGVSSGMTYAGARSISEYTRFAVMALQMPSGYEEGKAKATV